MTGSRSLATCRHRSLPLRSRDSNTLKKSTFPTFGEPEVMHVTGWGIWLSAAADPLWRLFSIVDTIQQIKMTPVVPQSCSSLLMNFHNPARFTNNTEDIPVCLPAFKPERCLREEEGVSDVSIVLMKGSASAMGVSNFSLSPSMQPRKQYLAPSASMTNISHRKQSAKRSTVNPFILFLFWTGWFPQCVHFSAENTFNCFSTQR